MPEINREEHHPSESSAVRWRAFVDEELEKDHARRAEQSPPSVAKHAPRVGSVALWALVVMLVLIAFLALWFLIH